MNELVKGANALLAPMGGSEIESVLVEIDWTQAASDLTAAAFLVNGQGKVIGNEYFVFFNNPTSPDKCVWLLEPDEIESKKTQIGVNLNNLHQDVQRIRFTIASMSDEESLRGVSGLKARIIDLISGEKLIFTKAEGLFNVETLAIIFDIYRHTTGWKARAVLQGYASGLRGIAVDLGVEVE